MRVLGIETSCDETGIALYDSNTGLLAHALYSQITIHAPFGGVVPELASRDHIRKTVPMIQEVLDQAGSQMQTVDGVAYTAGPGLVGALMVGAAIGRSLGFAWNVPTIGVHHMEGHLLAPMLEENRPNYPFLALLVSGGHSQFVKVTEWGRYEILGESIDDAVGEAFDKTAKLLGLGYPGGAALSALAERGRPNIFHFPRPMLHRPGLQLSFSGLKTAVANVVASTALDDQTKADIARAFQEAVVETLVVKTEAALRLTEFTSLVVAGGVAANQALRSALEGLAAQLGVQVYFPRPAFCTDNGAMIAYAGCQRLLSGYRDDDSLAIQVYPRWPLSLL